MATTAEKSESPVSHGFERQRGPLTGLAHRLLRSSFDAEDVVQDAYVRLHVAARADLQNPPAFLHTVVTRLCIDRLRSARQRNEALESDWLSEREASTPSMPSTAHVAEDFHDALVTVLERLSPLERAAFFLHDVFDVEFFELGELLGTTETASRQLLRRARLHVRTGERRFRVSTRELSQFAQTFRAASRTGRTAALEVMLATDVMRKSPDPRRNAARSPLAVRRRVFESWLDRLEDFLQRGPANGAVRNAV
jgi:RNA polymerase sigma-70 factor, ECF subfamily